MTTDSRLQVLARWSAVFKPLTQIRPVTVNKQLLSTCEADGLYAQDIDGLLRARLAEHGHDEPVQVAGLDMAWTMDVMAAWLPVSCRQCSHPVVDVGGLLAAWAASRPQSPWFTRHWLLRTRDRVRALDVCDDAIKAAAEVWGLFAQDDGDDRQGRRR